MSVYISQEISTSGSFADRAEAIARRRFFSSLGPSWLEVVCRYLIARLSLSLAIFLVLVNRVSSIQLYETAWSALFSGG